MINQTLIPGSIIALHLLNERGCGTTFVGPVLGYKNRFMKLEQPKLSIQQVRSELEAINGNVFQLKAFAKVIVDMIEKGETAERMKHVVDIFKPLDAVNNLEIN